MTDIVIFFSNRDTKAKFSLLLTQFLLSLPYSLYFFVFAPAVGNTNMQSFIQYRSFRTSVKHQYERDSKKAEELRRKNENTNTEKRSSSDGHSLSAAAASNTSDTSEGPDSRDPEKAEQSPASPDSQPSDSQQGNNGNEGFHDGDPAKRIHTNNTLEATQTFGTAMGTILTGIEVRPMTRQMSNRLEKRVTRNSATGNKNNPPKDKVFVVNYESENDPLNPHNWSYGRRIFCTMLIALIGLIVGFASSIDSSALPQASKAFGVGEVTESLATGIFLIGFGFGALFAGPISETVGRNPVYITTLFM